MGHDRYEYKPFYNHSQLDGKSYLDDGTRGKIFENHDNRNLIDFYTTHHNRIAPIFNGCTFQVFEQQAVRIQFQMTYKTDIGVFLNQRSGIVNGVKGYLEEMHLFLFDQFGQIIDGTRAIIPRQEIMSEYTYDRTITLPKGLYSFVHHGRKDGHYNMRAFTISKMNCTIAGAKPRELEINHNGFLSYLLIKDPGKSIAGYESKEGLEPIINNPARTTIRFRKIRF